MTYKTAIIVTLFAATGCVLAGTANAAVPPVDRVGKPALQVCPAPALRETIQHFDKVIFQLGVGNLVPIVAADAAALNAIPRGTELDIKIIDDPRTVADLKSKVLSFLGAQALNPANRQLVRIEGVVYATAVCSKTQ